MRKENVNMADDLELLELGEDFENFEDLEDLEDPFVGRLAGRLGGKIKRIAAKVSRKCGPTAGRCALGVIKSELGGVGRLLPESDFEDFEDLEDLEDPFLGRLGGKAKKIAAKIAQKCGSKAGKCAYGVIKSELGVIGGLLPESDMEDFEDLEDFEDFEGDHENFEDLESDYEDLEVPAEMAVLAQEAADADSEEEADAFFGAIAGLLPKVLPMAKKFLPHLIRAGKGIFGKLFRRRRRRPGRAAMEAMPAITMETAKRLARHAAAGGTVTPATANRVMAGVARRVLGNPITLIRCIRRCRRQAAMQRRRPRTAA
jgi:hypothetical protein